MPSDSERLRAALADDFEIIEEIGRGGMAIVFRARDKALGREVAIKVLPAHLMVDTGLVDRFEHEARTAGNLEHPNIITIHRVGRGGPQGDVSFIVMKLLRGSSLSAVLRERGKLPPDALRALLIEMASALGYAARQSVVHRDIKPDNILFDNAGRAVLTDFGIAKAPGGHHSVTGTLVGTPRYMSPEHASGLPLDGRSDLYSLGVVAYECLFGQAPFDSDNPLEIIYQHLHEPIPVPALRADDERQLFHVIARMLAKKPEDRFQTADEVIAALGATAVETITGPVTTPSAIRTEPVAMTSRGRKSWRRPMAGVAMLGALAAVAAAVGVGKTRGALMSSPAAAPGDSQPVVLMAAATPPVVGGVDTVAPRAVAPPPPKPVKPRPSARAAAILAYNRLRSSCARRDTVPDAKPIAYAVLVDSLPDRPRADSMVVGYDVCGLSSGSSFTATFTLTKLRQRGFRQQKPYTETATATAGSPRARKRRVVDTRALSAGSYRLDIVVTDGEGRPSTASREFRITDK